MEIPLIVSDHQYSRKTRDAWQTVWKTICEMSYSGTNVCEEIVTSPGYFQVDDEVMMETGEADQANFYGRRYAINDEQIILDFMWKNYSKDAGPLAVLHIIPQFKRLHVPAHLFYTLGVDSWFKHSFPNCTVTFWES